MKKLIIATLLMLSVGVRAETGTATTNAVSVVAPSSYGPVYTASIVNTGTNTIYVRKNVSVAGFVLTNAIPVPPSYCYTTYTPTEATKPVSRVGNVVIATESGESGYVIGFE